MPVLHNPKWEIFAQARASGFSTTEAYHKAGYTSKNHRNAMKMGSELNNKPVISARILEIQEARSDAATSKVTYQRDDIIRELWATYANASREGKYAAAKGCLELLGLERGMFPRERKLLTGRIDPLESMDEAGLLHFISAAFTELGLEVDLGGLAAAVGLEGAVARLGPKGARAALPETLDVQAVPEAEGLPAARGDQERAASDGGEPAREEPHRGLRDSPPPDRTLS